MAWALGWMAAAAGLGTLATRGIRESQTLSKRAGPVLATLFIAPFLLEFLRPLFGLEGYPLELQLLMALRNVGLGLAAFSAVPLCMRSACVVSLFLVLFSVTMIPVYILGGGGVYNTVVLVFCSTLPNIAALLPTAQEPQRAA